MYVCMYIYKGIYIYIMKYYIAIKKECVDLENPRDGGAWWAAISGVTESDTTEVT